MRGTVLREIVARPPGDVLLVLEPAGARPGEGRVRRVLLSADPEAPRLCLVRGRFERHDGPLGPFFRRLASELPGATLAGIAPVAGDRLVLVEWRDTPAAERRALVLELFGRHANLVLLGPGDVVLDLLVPPPAGKRGARLEPGKVWSAPPRTKRAEDAPDGAEPPQAGDPWALWPAPSAAHTEAPLSARVEELLGRQAAEARLVRERRRVAERLERRLERARGLQQGLERRRAAAHDFELVRQEGELLKANLAQVPRGARSIEVDDFYAGEGARRTLALDPKLGPRENLERLFDKARKLERSLAAVADELARAGAQLAGLSDCLARLADAPEPEAIEREAIDVGLLEAPQDATPRARAEPAARLPYKAFHGLRGSEIRVGRTARDNDALTFRHARGSDLWLHTADTPGSHVVLRSAQREQEPDPEELIDAAHLAVHFSPLRGAGRARVHVARQKEVHKPRGAKPGLVTLSGGKILELRLQPERLQRLLGSHRPPA